MSKTYDDSQHHPDGVSGADVIPDTHDNTDVVLTTRGPGHGETHYIPGDGFLVSHGGFSTENKSRVYKRKKEEILSQRPKSQLPRMHDDGTFLSEEEILEYAAAIRTHRQMTGAKGAKERAFEKARARTHAGTDAVDSAKDGLHKQSDDFDIDKSRSTIFISLGQVGPTGMALNGSKIYHRSVVHITITSPDGRRVCEVAMSPEQFAAALVGNSYTPCTLSHYWSINDENVMLTERARPPVSIRKRMEKRLRHRLKEQGEALQKVADELVAQAESGKPARKTQLRDLAERLGRAMEHTAANSAFTVDQAREEITGIMESAAIQFIGQQALDAKTLWEAAGPALGTSDDDDPKLLTTNDGEENDPSAG